MTEMYSRQVNDTRIEVFGFKDICTNLIANDVYTHGIYKLEDASEFVDDWITNDELPEDYRQWLKNSVDAGATIYTYYEDWQPITEVAVF